MTDLDQLQRTLAEIAASAVSTRKDLTALAQDLDGFRASMESLQVLVAAMARSEARSHPRRRGETIGLRARRTRLGLTQADLGKRLGLPQTAISRIERGLAELPGDVDRRLGALEQIATKQE